MEEGAICEDAYTVVEERTAKGKRRRDPITPPLEICNQQGVDFVESPALRVRTIHVRPPLLKT